MKDRTEDVGGRRRDLEMRGMRRDEIGMKDAKDIMEMKIRRCRRKE